MNPKKNNIGSRGKSAEKKVDEWLTRMGERYVTFDWERIYDARSAGGRFPSRPGDFAFYSLKLHGLIEVKEVEHDFRLPAKNFKTGQLAKLYKRELAGGVIRILVCHTTTGLWREVPLQWFRERLKAPSWDLSSFPTALSAAAVLDGIQHLVEQRAGS